MQIELKPFQVPNFVIQMMPPRPLSEGIKECPTYPLNEVPAEDLAQMCDDFRRSVFQRAQKIDPRMVAIDTTVKPSFPWPTDNRE